MHKGFAAAFALLATLAFGAACTVHNTQAPSVSGVSEFGLSLAVTATPDSILQDGGSQSQVQVVVRDDKGNPRSGVSLRVDMAVGGVMQDFGTLSARTVVSGSNGKTPVVVYTAPPPPPPAAAGTTSRVSIVVTPIGTDAQASSPQVGPASMPTTVDIRLVPPGVILPPAGTPTAAFTMSPTQALANVPVTFDASGSTVGAGATQITSYAWNFGDGSQGSGRSVAHTFTSQQTFNVTLTVTNDRGLSASATTAVAVGALALPSPKFVFSPTAPAAGQTVVFNADQSTAAPGHTLTAFNWNFGDGATSTGFLVSHVFTTAGTYNVVLAVLDDAGQKGTIAQTVTVTAAGGGGAASPTAKFTFSPAAPATGQTVFFNASSSTAGTGHTLASYAWNFGDGSTGTGVTPTHAFAANGTFTVTLTVTDETGQAGVTSLPITIASGAGGTAPTATFTFSPASPGVRETVFFNASTSAAGAGHTIASYAWTFGDGVSASGVTTSHAYSTAGSYSVQLKVTDEAGQSTTSAPTAITVGTPPAPTSNFTFSPLAPAVGQQVVFDASTSVTAQGQTIVDVAWNYGDGTAVVHCGTLFGNDPSCVNVPATNRVSAHTYAFTGTFTVNLVVTDSAGRTGSKAQQITVVPPGPTAVLFLAKTGGNSIQADGSGSTATGSFSIVNYLFIWGDGTADTSGATTSVSHTFAAPGVHTVTLVVTDSRVPALTGATSKDITTP